MTPRIFTIIPAGGSGSRFGGETKKQFLELEGEAILTRTLKTFLKCPEITRIIVCLPQDEFNKPQALQDERIQYVIGGKSRSDSVYQGFKAITDLHDDDRILVHDAARPLLTQTLIQSIIQKLETENVVIPAMSVSDTIKKVSPEGYVTATIPREDLVAVQTPQGFRAASLKQAYQKLDFSDARFTDESMLVEAAGFRVRQIEGEATNIKITRPVDLVVAAAFLKDL